jgi:Flp pilus assembly protein TadD
LAALSLGLLLVGQEDIIGARAAFQQAIDSNHPDAAPLATFSLGALLAEQGDTEGARVAFQRTIDSNHPEATPMAVDWLRRIDS